MVQIATKDSDWGTHVGAKDHHTALRTESLGHINAGYIEITLAKLQWGRDDVAFTLHVNPSAFTLGGLQTTDWLRFLGFKENAQCQFTNARQCFSKEVPEEYDLGKFATAFNEGFGQLQKAEAGFQACGVRLPGRRQLSAQATAFHQEISTDGHMAMSTKPMSASEDDRFRYRFSFIDTGREKGL